MYYCAKIPSEYLMTRVTEKKLNEIYQAITDRFPSTYPIAKLIIHKDIKLLRQSYNRTEEKDGGGEAPFAFCDGENNTIHISLAFSEEELVDIMWYFLHEVGHLYALEKYGSKDSRWNDYKTAESYANKFANRWLSRLKKEDFINKC